MATRSSTPCMVRLTRPNSTTSQYSLMKRASEVPPDVDSTGLRPVTSAMLPNQPVTGRYQLLDRELLDGCLRIRLAGEWS